MTDPSWVVVNRDKSRIAMWLDMGEIKVAAGVVVFLLQQNKVVKISHLKKQYTRKLWSRFLKQIAALTKKCGCQCRLS